MTNTKDTIIKTAQQLFGRFGLNKTTVDEIAKLARIGKGTIYHYFKSKEDIFVEVIDKESQYLKEKILQAVQQADSPKEKLRIFTLTRIRVIKELANIYYVLQSEYLLQYDFVEKARQNNFREEISIVKNILEEGINSGIFEVEDAEATAFAMITVLKGLEYPWTIKTLHSDIEKSVDTMMRILLRGIEKR